MLGGLAIPCGGGDVVSRHTFALFVHSADFVLRIGIALDCGLAQPLERRAKIGRITQEPLFVRLAEPKLGASISPPGSRQERFFIGFGPVRRSIFAAQRRRHGFFGSWDLWRHKNGEGKRQNDEQRDHNVAFHRLVTYADTTRKLREFVGCF